MILLFLAVVRPAEKKDHIFPSKSHSDADEDNVQKGDEKWVQLPT